MNFTAKFELAFIKTLENTFSLRFRFKITRKSIDSSRDFQNSSPFNRSACFYLTISGNYERFLYFQKTEYRFLVESTKIENASFPYKSACQTPMLRQIEWWVQNGLIEVVYVTIGNPAFCLFLFLPPLIFNWRTFSRRGTPRWWRQWAKNLELTNQNSRNRWSQIVIRTICITNNGVLPVTTLLFWKFCFGLRTSYKELTWCTNYPNVHIHTFRKRWSFIWGYFFPMSILKETYGSLSILQEEMMLCLILYVYTLLCIKGCETKWEATSYINCIANFMGKIILCRGV